RTIRVPLALQFRNTNDIHTARSWLGSFFNPLVQTPDSRRASRPATTGSEPDQPVPAAARGKRRRRFPAATGWGRRRERTSAPWRESRRGRTRGPPLCLSESREKSRLTAP